MHHRAGALAQRATHQLAGGQALELLDDDDLARTAISALLDGYLEPAAAAA